MASEQTILLIDGSAENSTLLSRSLQLWGYRVLSLEPDTNIAAFLETAPALHSIILGDSLAAETSVALIRSMKRHPLSHHVPLLTMVAANDSDHDHHALATDWALRQGADQTLDCPIDEGKLRNWLSELIPTHNISLSLQKTRPPIAVAQARKPALMLPTLTIFAVAIVTTVGITHALSGTASNLEASQPNSLAIRSLPMTQPELPPKSAFTQALAPPQIKPEPKTRIAPQAASILVKTQASTYTAAPFQLDTPPHQNATLPAIKKAIAIIPSTKKDVQPPLPSSSLPLHEPTPSNPRAVPFSVALAADAKPLSPAKPEPATAAAIPPQEIKLEEIHFSAGVAALSPGAQIKTRRAADAILKNPGAHKIKVLGFSDSVGGKRANLRMAQRRARAVAALLVKSGVRRDLIEIISKGESDTPFQTADGVDEPENRCVGIKLLTTTQLNP